MRTKLHTAFALAISLAIATHAPRALAGFKPPKTYGGSRVDVSGVTQMMLHTGFTSSGGVFFGGKATFLGTGGQPIANDQLDITSTDAGVFLVVGGKQSRLEDLTDEALCALNQFVLAKGDIAFSFPPTRPGENSNHSAQATLSKLGLVKEDPNDDYFIARSLRGFDIDDMSLSDIDLIDQDIWLLVPTPKALKEDLESLLKANNDRLKELDLQLAELNIDKPALAPPGTKAKQAHPKNSSLLSKEARQRLENYRTALGEDKLRTLLLALRRDLTKENDDLKRTRDNGTIGLNELRSKLITEAGWKIWDPKAVSAVNRGTKTLSGDITFINADTGITYEVFVGGEVVDIANLPYRMAWGAGKETPAASLVADFPWPPEIHDPTRARNMAASIRAFQYVAVLRGMPNSVLTRIGTQCLQTRTQP